MKLQTKTYAITSGTKRTVSSVADGMHAELVVAIDLSDLSCLLRVSHKDDRGWEW